jgi:hypothetical protein
MNDKQLGHIQLEDVLKKRRIGQALNMKEFAVLAGISYCAARLWFREPGFPVFRGVVFWLCEVACCPDWFFAGPGGSGSAEKSGYCKFYGQSAARSGKNSGRDGVKFGFYSLKTA